jgi:hypothetical protein
MTRDFTPSEIFFALPATAITPTSFIANWEDIADEYYITVARDPMFWDILNDYRDLRVFTNAQQVSGLTLGIRYYYKVRYKANGIYSDDSNIISALTQVALSAPVALAATNVSYANFYCNWEASTGAEGYTLEIYDDVALTNLVDSITSLEVLSYNWEAAQPAITYYYRVAAYIGVEQSDWSNTISVLTLSSDSRYFAFSDSTITGFYPTGIDDDLPELFNVIIPSFIGASKVRLIAEAAFEGWRDILFVYVPNSVLTIGQLAFESCSSMYGIRLGNRLTSIGQSAFANTGLTSIEFNIPLIPESVCDGCSSLETITLNGNEGTVSTLAFNGCPITSITIGGTWSIDNDENTMGTNYGFAGTYIAEGVYLWVVVAWVLQ